MEFIEFLQAKWSYIIVISAIVVSLILCASASLHVAINEFKEGNYNDFGSSLMLFIFFGISLILLTL